MRRYPQGSPHFKSNISDVRDSYGEKDVRCCETIGGHASQHTLHRYAKKLGAKQRLPQMKLIDT